MKLTKTRIQRIRLTVLAATACLAWGVDATAANSPVTPATSATAAPQRLAPIVRPTPAQAAAARAAVLERMSPPPVPATLPPMAAEKIAEKNTAARGGLAAWQKVQSMSLTGKLDAGKTRRDGGAVAAAAAAPKGHTKADWRKALASGQVAADAPKVIQLPFTMDLQRPVKTRLEIPFQGQTAVQVYDGSAGWKLRPYLGRHEVEPYSADELKIAAGQQELDGPLINHAAKGTKLEVVGGEMVEGRGAYKLKMTLKNGDVRHVWVDAQNFLEVKIEGAPRRIGGKLRPVYTYFRDYRAENGLQIAHRLDTQVEGLPGAERILIEKVALNPTLAGSRFARPE